MVDFSFAILQWQLDQLNYNQGDLAPQEAWENFNEESAVRKHKRQQCQKHTVTQSVRACFWCFDIDNVDLQHSGPRKTFTTFIAPKL